MKYYPKSRASGTCKQCGKAIQKGQPAWWSQSRGWRCTGCNPAEGAVEPKAEPVPASSLPPVRITGDRELQVEFNNLLDAATTATSMGQGHASNIEELDDQLRGHNGKRFFGYRSIEQVAEQIRTGNKEMTELVESLRSELSQEVARPAENRRRLRRGRENGDEIDQDRFLGRIPEMWSRIEREAQPARRAFVTINGSVHYGQNQDDLGYRAAAALVLADHLTQNGTSVEIRLKIRVGDPSSKVRRYTTTVVVKQSDQPMNIPELATACCDIGAVRLAMAFGTSRVLPGEIDSGLGSPLALPESEDADFVVDRSVTSRQAAVEWLKANVNKFNGEGVSNG